MSEYITKTRRGHEANCPICGLHVTKYGRFWEFAGCHNDPNAWKADETAALRAELDEVKAQRDALIEPHIIISVFGEHADECLVNVCQSIDLETINGVMGNLDVFIDEWVDFDDMPDKVVCALYKITDIHYEDAQIGNYPPPNVEVPGYWDFNWEFLRYEYEPKQEEIES